MPSLKSTDDAGRREEAEGWCDRFAANTDKWLKSTVVSLKDNEPDITYEDIDTSSIPPRPRLYGLVGAEVIDEVWTERLRQKQATQPEAAQPEAVAGSA